MQTIVMQLRTLKSFARVVSKLAIICIVACFALSSHMVRAASPINPAQEPLFTASTNLVYPNLMFLLDASGSMSWDFVPDYVRAYSATVGEPSCFDDGDTSGTSIADVRKNCAVGDPPFMSPDFNLIYYNPDFTYQPGWNGTLATPAAFPAQSPTATNLDPYGKQKNTQLTNGNSGTTIDLTTSYPDRAWCLKSGMDIAATAAWIQVNSVTSSSTISALKVGATNVLSGTTTAASTAATVAANLVAKVSGSYSTVYTAGATGFWLVGPSGVLSATLATGSPVIGTMLTLNAFEPACRVNANLNTNTSLGITTFNTSFSGYSYPDGTFKYLPGSGGTVAASVSSFIPAASGRYTLGAPYYWRIIPTEYCRDVEKTNCVDWTLANAVIGGAAATTSKYCTDTGRTFSLCQASEDLTHRFPAKCTGSACVEPGQGGTFVYPAPTRFCKPDSTNPQTDPLLNCQGAYNAVSGHVIPKHLGYVIPSAGDNAFGIVTIGAVYPGQTITSITVAGSATNLLTSTYTVPAGATPASVAAELACKINNGTFTRATLACASASGTSYKLQPSNNGVTVAAQGNVLRITSAVVGTADNDSAAAGGPTSKVITVLPAPSGGDTIGTPATATITVSAGSAGVADYRLGAICVGTVSGSFPTQTCSDALISTSTDVPSVDLSTALGRETAATAIANSINNLAAYGYTASSTNEVVTITAAGVGNTSLPINFFTPSLAADQATGTIAVGGSLSGLVNYKLDSVTIGGVTKSSGAVTGNWDLTTGAGRTAAALAIANVIGGGYTAVSSSNLVTITSTVPGSAGNLALAAQAAGVAAAGSITVSAGTSTSKTYTINSVKVGTTELLTGSATYTGVLSTTTGRNNAAAAIRSKIGNGYTATVGGTGQIVITANTPGIAPQGVVTMTFSSGNTFAFTKADIAGGKEPLPVVVTGLSGGTDLTLLAVTRTSFSGGTNATGAVQNTTEAFQGGSAAGAEKRADVGRLMRCDIIGSPGFSCGSSVANTFPKAATRTDCLGATCTYAEESVNFANWYAFYRTRLQSMKTGAGLAFSGIGSTYRVGFTILGNTSTSGSNFLSVADFSPTQKQSWYTKFYAQSPTSSTPLRSSLARIGQMYAHKGDLASADPVQYSCQQNFVLMTTDGYWNSDDCSDVKQVDNSTDIGQQDGAPTLTELQVDSQMWDGNLGGSCLNQSDGPSSVETLADVSYYYAHTDLRTTSLSNCANGLLGAAQDVCKNNVPHVNSSEPVFQHMSTFTLGLGVSGTLRYQRDYDTSPTGDFADIKSKNKKWPQVTAGSQTTVDDLWHTAVNGFGKYFSASNPSILKSNLDDALSTIKSSVGSGAAAATSAQALTTNTQNFSYVASYQTVYWFGNLEARTVDALTATTSPAASWCVSDVLGDLSTGATACSGKLKTQVGAASDTRNIYLRDAAATNGLRSFTYANLTSTEKGYFEPCSPAAPLTALSQCGLFNASTLAGTTPQSMVNYLRGQYGQELESSSNVIQSYRSRRSAFGDAVGSQPVYQGAPTGRYNDAGYSTFVTTATGSNFPETVYIGANDGMLHAFDANTGVERWAYIPTQMLPKMRLLADDVYSASGQHRFFVNAAPLVADVCFNPCASDGSDWHTILVGGYGAGGKGYFALDITDPTDPIGLWEFGTNNDADVGNSYATPIITKRPDGRWVVLVSSGYQNNSGSGSGTGVLFSLDPETGTVLTKISNNSGSVASPSGLSAIEAFITDAVTDNTTNDVYGGDLDGNLWRFRLTVGSESVVKIAQLADTAGVAQPITTKPVLTTLDDAARSRYIIVGTGKLLQVPDLTDTQSHSVYAFKEGYDAACSPIAACVTAVKGLVTDSSGNRGSVSVVPSTGATVGHCGLTNATSPPLPGGCPNGARNQLTGVTMVPDGQDSKGRDLRKSSSTTIAPTKTPVVTGCYANLPEVGERVNINPVLENGKVLAVSNVPESTVCSTGGRSFANYLDYKTCKVVLSYELGSALAVGITTVRTAPDSSGLVKTVPLITLANNPTPEVGEAIPEGDAAYGGRRLGWRLLND